MFRTIGIGLILAVASCAIAQERVSATEKGSLLVYPKVELRWDAGGNLKQDTFITINNDLNFDVKVQLYFVSETCVAVDNVITLTHNEPAYWSVVSGLPKGVSPWTVLGDPYLDPQGSGDFVMRGYVLAWAVNADLQQIRWNHLYGGATLVHYAAPSAWEYNAYAFQVVSTAVPHGAVAGTPGQLDLDGLMYDSGFEYLLLDFFASGGNAFTKTGYAVVHDTDLTLLILRNDLRQDSYGPYTTKARFEIWNQNEIGFSGMEYCFTKWDQTLLSARGGHFLVANLQTNKGRARILGMQSSVCPDSTDESMLGVVAKVLSFNGGPAIARCGTNLFGSGTRSSVINYDVPGAPPPEQNAKLGSQVAPVSLR